MVDQRRIAQAFADRFGTEPNFYAAPGRVNLIGEHTDYNDGFVLPGAIDKAVTVAIRLNGTRKVNVVSLDFGEEATFAAKPEKTPQAWANYILGVAMEFRSKGFEVPGFDAVFAGDVPLGGGMSSSAALESVFAFALNDLCGFKLSRLDLARIGQSAEHNYAGVRCGIMDQYASLHGEAGKLLKLDCRSLTHELIPFAISGYTVTLIDTCVKHSLASSEYNVRRAECEAAAKAMGITSLRDADFSRLEAVRHLLPEKTYMRAQYVLQENTRVETACNALAQRDTAAFGAAMFASHEGLKSKYEVSCAELDFLVDCARGNKNVIGARMMGGGFGGCTINLVKDAAHEDFLVSTGKTFAAKFGSEPKTYEVVISDGARRLP